MLPLRELPLIFHRPLPDPHRDARAVGNARLLHAGRRVSRAPSQAGSDARFPVAAHARADRSRRRRAGGCATATGETPRACPNASPGRLSRGKINKMCVWARGDDRKITRATDPPAGSHPRRSEGTALTLAGAWTREVASSPPASARSGCDLRLATRATRSVEQQGIKETSAGILKGQTGPLAHPFARFSWL